MHRLRKPWTDRRAELLLGALASLVLVSILLMIVFVAIRAWPSFLHNGLHWFGAGGDVDRQISDMVNTGADPAPEDYALSAWPLIWATILTTGLAVILGLGFALLAAIFLVEFAPSPAVTRDFTAL